jgi:hypothetical protein
MLLQLLKNNHIPGIIFLVFLVALTWLRSFIALPESGQVIAMPFYQLTFGAIEQHKTASLITGIIIYTIIMLLIIRLNVLHFLLDDRSYMPAAFYLMIVASWPPALQLNPILVSSPFLVLALLMLLRGEEHRAEPLALFSATLILALGSLFYLKIIWFIPILWITASVIRPLTWRGIINPLLVLLLMGLFAVTYYWVIIDDLSLLPVLIERNLAFSLRDFSGFEMPVYLLLGYLVLMILITSIHLLRRFYFRKIMVRKLYQVLFILFVYCLLFYVFVSGFRAQILSLAALPVAYLFSNFFQQRNTGWLHELMIWIWMIMLFYVHFGDLIFS